MKILASICIMNYDDSLKDDFFNVSFQISDINYYFYNQPDYSKLFNLFEWGV